MKLIARLLRKEIFMSEHGIIFDIQRNSFVDGPGIRTTVFFKGCNLRCAWCHNPESHRTAPELLIFKNKCTECGRCKSACEKEICTACGRCTEVCQSGAREISGKPYTIEELIREIKKDVRFFAASGGGVTFSGGECMLQVDFLQKALMACHENGISTAVDTAGNVPYESFEKILPYVDLFLYDIKCIDKEKHKRYTGACNELILKNLQKLISAGKRIHIRIPIIPTVNDTVAEMTEIKKFLEAAGVPEQIELLPYHTMGEHKYAALGKVHAPFPIPTEEKMAELREIFK